MSSRWIKARRQKLLISMHLRLRVPWLTLPDDLAGGIIGECTAVRRMLQKWSSASTRTRTASSK
jgi:hypothetical protein